MNYFIDVNNSEVKNYSDKLRKMHRSNFPVAVRQTLNDLAFDVKKNTLLESADHEFILRNPSFFKSHSGVEAAKGWDIKAMKSEVGIIAKGSEVAMELRKQEFGGKSKKPMIYVNAARAGNNKAKLVRMKNYINTKGVIKGAPNLARNDEPQFVANAVMAKKTGKLLFARTRSGTAIFEVNNIRFGRNKSGTTNIGGRNYKWRGRDVKVKMTPLADYEQNRTITIKAHPFLLPASEKTFRKSEQFFISRAKARFEKALQ